MRKISKYFVFVILLLSCSSATSNAQNLSQTSINQAEVNKITEIAVSFMKAYAADDLVALDSFSSEKTEVKNKIRQPGWEYWQGRKNLIFNNFVNQITRIEGAAAGVRITFTLRETDSDNIETLKPISFNFSLIKENGKWKVADVEWSISYIVTDLLSAQNESAFLEIAKQEKFILNSAELDFVLDELQNRIVVDKNKIIKIFEALDTQIDQPKYKNTFLYKQGWLLINSSKFDQAEKSFLESVSLSQTLKDDLFYASSLISLGGAVYLNKNMDTEAAQVIDKGIAILLGKPNLVNKQLSWIRTAGNHYFNQQKYELAKEYYEQGEKIAEKSNQTAWLAVFIKDIGDCGWYVEKYSEALQQYQKLAFILERPEEKEGFLNGNEAINLPTIYTVIGNTLERLDRKSEAQSLFEKSCGLAQNGKSAQDLNFACNALIEYYFRNDSDQKAIENFNKLSGKLYELKADAELAEQVKSFALTLLEKGRINLSERILEFWSEKISPNNRASIYLAQAVVYQMNYKWSLTQKACMKIIDSKFSTNDEKVTAAISMAAAYAVQLQKEEGLDWINKALVFAKETTDTKERSDAITLVQMMKMMFVLEEGKTAQNITELEKIIKENENNDFIVAYANYWIGLNYFTLTEDDDKPNPEIVEKSIKALQKSLEFFDRSEDNEYKPVAGQVHFTLALIYKELKDFKSALESLNKAKKIINETEIDFMKGYLDLTESEIQTSLGNFKKARENFKNGIEGLDRQKKYVGGGVLGQLNFNSAFRSTFQKAVETELKLGNIENAVVIADLARGQVLRELTQNENKPDWLRADNTTKNVITTTVFKDDKLGVKILPSKSNSSIEQASKQIESLNLNKDTAVLNYFIDDDNIHLFVLTADKEGLNQLPSWQHYTIKYDYLVKYKVRRFQNLLRNNNTDYRQLAKELYDVLLKPAEKQINDKSALIIVPDSFLWQLPFQALIAKDSANPNDVEQEKFVIEKFAVQYSFSLSHLIDSERKKKNRLDQQTKTGNVNVLAVGNSTFGEQEITLKPVPEVSSPFEDKPLKIEFTVKNGIAQKIISSRTVKLSPLPGAAIEAKNLTKIYGVKKLDEWIDSNAVKNKFIEKASSYKVIHIATHGILDDENPLNSSLVFNSPLIKEQNTIAGKTRKPVVVKQPSKSSSYGEEYLLTAKEILSELHLNADLVVLSACDTADGEISEGEGLIGLTWAFLGVGATNVVASQWKVDDGKTPELMKVFHQQLQDKKQDNSIPVAWQKSVKILIQNPIYYHPYYWAGFISVGAP